MGKGIRLQGLKPLPMIACAIIIFHSSISFANLLIDLPLDDEVYREVYCFVDRMVARGYITMLKNTRPYLRGEIAKVLIELDTKVKQGKLKLSRIEKQRLKNIMSAFSEELQDLHYSSASLKKSHLFQTQGKEHHFAIDFGIGENIISRKQSNTKRQTAYAILFRPTVSGKIRDDFAFYSDLKVYYLSAIQFEIPKREVTVPQLYAETVTAGLTAYHAKFKLPWFELFIGKDNLSWGPGRHGALLISDNPTPMNLVKLTVRYHPVEFQGFTSTLGSELGKKYLSGHRLEFHLWEKLRLGIAEVIVYGQRFETIYLNPLQLYAVTEIPIKIVKGEPVDTADNVLISGDLDIVMLKNVELYGELVVDDFRPFSFGLRSYRNWASKFGVLFGCYYINPFSLSDTELRIEYAFINQYTYTHRFPINTYTHFNSIIGHKIGTDADDLWFNLRHWFSEHFALSLGYELERHGEGNVNKPHPKDAPDDDEWEFLSCVTESTHSICLGASYNLIGKYSVALEYTRSWVKNALNQDGVNDISDGLLLSGQYRF